MSLVIYLFNKVPTATITNRKRNFHKHKYLILEKMLLHFDI